MNAYANNNYIIPHRKPTIKCVFDPQLASKCVCSNAHSYAHTNNRAKQSNFFFAYFLFYLFAPSYISINFFVFRYLFSCLVWNRNQCVNWVLCDIDDIAFSAKYKNNKWIKGGKIDCETFLNWLVYVLRTNKGFVAKISNEEESEKRQGEVNWLIKLRCATISTVIYAQFKHSTHTHAQSHSRTVAQAHAWSLNYLLFRFFRNDFFNNRIFIGQSMKIR